MELQGFSVHNWDSYTAFHWMTTIHLQSMLGGEVIGGVLSGSVVVVVVVVVVVGLVVTSSNDSGDIVVIFNCSPNIISRSKIQSSNRVQFMKWCRCSS